MVEAEPKSVTETQLSVNVPRFESWTSYLESMSGSRVKDEQRSKMAKTFTEGRNHSGIHHPQFIAIVSFFVNAMR